MQNHLISILALLFAATLASAAVDPITSFNNLDFDDSTSGTTGGFDTGGYDVPGWTDYGAPLTDAGIGGEPGVPGDWWSAQDGYAAFMDSGDAAYTMSTYTIQSGDEFAIDFYAMHWEWEGTGEWTVTLFYDNPANVIGTFVQGGLPNNGTWTRYTSPAIPATPASVGGTLGILFESTGTGISQVDEITVGYPLDLQYYWGDDFSGNAVNESKWNIASPSWAMSTASPTAETGRKVHVGDGILTLEATRTKVSGSSTPGDEIFDGGMISTYGKHNFNGGYIEARIWLPDTVGSWPAFWGLYDGWPPEMDIMEYPLGAYANDVYHTAFHHSGGSGAGPVNPGSAGDLRGSWHVYAANWIEDDDVTFYFDGQWAHNFGDDAKIAEMVYMYLILNYAVAGWPGVPTTGEWPVGFTDQTLVDWVRVWKPGPTKGTDWQGDGAGSNAAWNNAGHWSNGEPTLGGVTANFDTITPEASQTVDIPGTRRASIINLDGATRYRFGWDGDRLILGFGNLGAVQPAINMAATTTTEHEFWSILEWSGTLDISNDSTNHPLLLTGKLAGGDGLNLDGPGRVSFDGNANSFLGTVNIGVGQGPGLARARGQNALGHGDTVVIGGAGNATTARLELENNSLVSNPINLSGRNNASDGIANNSGSNSISGTIRAQTGGVNYWIRSDAGQLNLSGSSVAAGGIALSSLAGGNRTFTLKGAGDGMVGGAIENGSATTVNMVKDGAGTWVFDDGQNNYAFDGQNTYSGTTTVSNGTLVVNGSTGSGDTTVKSGATLAGRGEIQNNLIAESGATIRVGGDGIPDLLNIPFALIEDFESYDNSSTIQLGATPGNLTSDKWEGNYNGTAQAQVVDAASSPNGVQAARINGVAGVWSGMETEQLSIADGDTATVFFQFSPRSGTGGTGSGFDCMVGLSDSGNTIDEKDAWTDFAVMPFIVNGSSTFDFNVWDGTQGTTTMINEGTLNTWYNVWLVVNNSAKTFDVYTSTGTDAGVLAASGYEYRNGLGTGALGAFGMMQGLDKGNRIIFDNIYLAAGVDVSNPLASSAEQTAETLTVVNDMSLAAATDLEFDLFDTNMYDRLVVGGMFTAGGTLTVALDDGAPALAPGDVFDLFDAGSFAGSFASMDLPPLADGLKWNTALISNGVISVEIDASVFAGYMLLHGIGGAAFEGDANSNAVANGMEFYLGWNPTNPVTTNDVLTLGSNYQSVLYSYNPMASGVTGMVEWTADLMSSNWTSTEVTYVTNTMPDEIEADLGTATTNDQLFMRLKVEQ